MRAMTDRYGYALAVGALVTVAAIFRAWGVLDAPLDFWADEAWWVANTAHRHLSLTSIRPIGFQWLSQRLLEVGHQEIALRMPSLVAGILGVLAVAVAAGRLVATRWIALLAVAIVAVQPSLIVFAKEFKPYSVEVAIHAAFIAWALVCLQRRRAGIAFLLSPLAALPFAYNLVFLWPGLLFVACVVRRPDKMRVAALVIGAGVVLGAIVAHFTLYETLGMAARRDFWGAKYNVFPLDESVSGAAMWYAWKSWGLITSVADPVLSGRAIESAARFVFGVAWLAGAYALVTARRWPVVALLLGPLALAMLANVLGFWPYGDFRTNLFLMPSCALVGAAGLQWIWLRSRGVAIALGLALVLTLLPWNPGYHRHKHLPDGAGSPELTRVLDRVLADLTDSTADEHVIVADWHSWRPLHHYLTRSRWGARDYALVAARAALVRGPVNDAAALATEVAARIRAAQQDGTELRVWLVITKLRTMSTVLDDEVVSAHAISVTRLPAGEPDYHPIVVELVVPP